MLPLNVGQLKASIGFFGKSNEFMVVYMASHNPIQKQLEAQRFMRAIHYVEQAARGPKILSTSELAHLNHLVTGDDESIWRTHPTSVLIPSGKTHHWNVLSNPILAAREVIGEAQRLAGNGELFNGVFHLYSELVLQHVFNDANRRTAVLATLWLTCAYGGSLEAQKLADYLMGDIREKSDREELKANLKEWLALSESR